VPLQSGRRRLRRRHRDLGERRPSAPASISSLVPAGVEPVGAKPTAVESAAVTLAVVKPLVGIKSVHVRPAGVEPTIGV